MKKNNPTLFLTVLLLVLPIFAVDVLPDKGFTQTLNGDWNFKYLPTLDAGKDVDFYQPNFDVSAWKTIKVPSNWELQGFAEPSYALELKDGLGLYRRKIQIPIAWKNRKIFIRFEGVAYAFDAYLNGKKIGNSSASAYNPHTFEITDAVNANAENVMAVKVTTKPLGWDFDVNDDWALSGIFRDVTIFSLPETHFTDLNTSTKLNADGTANLTISAKLNQPTGNISGKLLDLRGKTVKTFQLDSNNQTVLEIKNPNLWTAETPNLYRLQLTLSDGKAVSQTIEERIGLREISIENSILKLNGKPIKLRGVDHHDIDPINGRAISEAQMKQDLELMKRGNINFIRTSHYPPDKRFIELADEMGFYVMDEVSIGKGDENLEKPTHRENILARIEPTIDRDKNRPSVIVWSIGNENPVTEVELEGGKIAKRLDPTRPICYPKIGSYFAANYQKIPEFVDIYSPHYPTNAMLADFATKLKRPTIFTEYAHALGLATDRIQDQWEVMQATPQFAGGAIWHFQDQGILRKSEKAVDRTKSTPNVWLDEFRHYDMHGNDGTDGIVYADRTPQTDFWLTRKVYSPVQIKAEQIMESVGVSVENRFDFRSLKGIKFVWSLKRNSTEIQKGTVFSQVLPKVLPHEEVGEIVSTKIPNDAAHDIFTFEIRAIDEKGMQITERSVRLKTSESQWLGKLPNTEKSTVSETQNDIKISRSEWDLIVSRQTGELKIQDKNGKILVEGIYPHSARKFTMAEARSAKSKETWLAATLKTIENISVKVSQKDSSVALSVSGKYPRPETPEQSFVGGYTAEILPNGVINFVYDYAPTDAKGLFSEAGLSVVLPFEMSEFRWIGNGPYAGYPGKDKLNEFGIFHLNRDDLLFQGNRRETEFALVSDADGVGVALATNPADVAVEQDGKRILLSHNAVISGLGNKFTVPETMVESAKVQKISGKFTLVPTDKNWNPQIVKWFGNPNGKAKIFRPFYHSYDQ